jgi:hypothetical protein
MKNLMVCAVFTLVGVFAADAFAQDCVNSCGVAGKAVAKVRTTAGRVACGAVCAVKGVACKATGVLHKAKAAVGTNCCDTVSSTAACVTSTTVTTVTTTTAVVAAADCGCGDCCGCTKEGVVSKTAKRVRGAFACAKDRRCARKAARQSCCVATTTVSCDSCAVSAAPTTEPTAALPPAPNAAEATLLSPNN